MISLSDIRNREGMKTRVDAAESCCIFIQSLMKSTDAWF